MKFTRWLLPLIIVLAACEYESRAVTIFADNQIFQLQIDETSPDKIFESAGIVIGPDDRIYYLGMNIPINESLPARNSYVLILHRSKNITLVTAGETRIMNTSAESVSQMLTEAGFSPQVSDTVDPPLHTPITAGMTVTWIPATDLTLHIDGKIIPFRASAETVGDALAEAGLALTGLDYSIPEEHTLLSSIGEIRVVRVGERISLAQTTLPFSTRTEISANLELDQQEVIQSGSPGLAVNRVRFRIEDGQQINQIEEGETIIRQVQDQIIGVGTTVIVRTTTVDGNTISYWRAVTVYATSYSPCRSGSDKCYYGTSSGLPVQKGVIAVASRWYPYIVGTGVYVPGYGYATVGDIGGGFPDRYWVDLAYSDADFVAWGSWITLYFLVPVPPNIQYELPYR